MTKGFDRLAGSGEIVFLRLGSLSVVAVVNFMGRSGFIDSGPDYTLLTSTNLVNWQPLFTTNPTAMPFSLTDTNIRDAHRFYRLQLSP